jgi:peptidoglycan/LPS O-acetylase OafA/YrhL
MLLGWWFTKGRVPGVAVSAAGLSAGMLLLMTYPLLGLANHSAPLFVAAAAVVGGAVSLERHGLMVRSRSALLLGASSYALYLCHPFVMQSAARLAEHMSQTAAVAVALASLPLAAACAILIHLIVERPMTSRLRTLTESNGTSERVRALGEVCT